jgi:hypothetical protein
MLKHDIERFQQILDAVRFDQPALKKEKPEEDADVEDCGGEPVDFHKKPDEDQGLEKVSLKDAKLSDVVSRLNLDELDKRNLLAAIQAHAVTDALPDGDTMFDAIVDSGTVKPRSECASVIAKALVNPEESQDGLAYCYVKYVVIPSLKGNVPREPERNSVPAKQSVVASRVKENFGITNDNEDDTEVIGTDLSKEDAERIAKEKNGTAVPQEEGSDKYMVVVRGKK